MKATKEMLAPLHHLKKRADFLRVQAYCRQDNPKTDTAKKWTAKSLTLQAARRDDIVPENEAGIMRVGFTVTKKMEKSAVKRNRIKRRLRAAASLILSQYGQRGMDYVLIARAEAATRPMAALERDILWCLEKIGHDKKAS